MMQGLHGESMAADDSALEQLKTPPHSREAEQSLLGGLLLDAQTWDQVAGMVTKEDFYLPEHRLIFEAMFKVAERNRPLDVLTISEQLDVMDEADNAGGIAYLSELAASASSASNVTAYAEIIRDRAVLRQLIRVAGEMSENARKPAGRSVSEILDEAESKVFKISEERPSRGGPEAVNHYLKVALKKIDELYASDSEITGVSTGFKKLDQMTAGLQQSDLVIIAGRPSMGKTTLAMCLVEACVIKSEKPTLVFSMEMPGESIVMRMLSSLGRIDQTKVRTGKLSDEDWPRLTSAFSLLNEKPLYIDDTPALTPTELRSRARRIARQHPEGLGMIMIDYLQLMQVAGGGENRAGEISEISRSLKALAKELNCPVIALSQLNRSLEQRPNKRPVMSDLRECVTGDTLVALADGNSASIASLVGQSADVLSVNSENKLEVARSEVIWSVGAKPTYELKFMSGRALVCSLEHRLLTSSGWTIVKDLSVGDKVAALPDSPQASVNRLGYVGNLAEVIDNVVPLEHLSDDLALDEIVAISEAGDRELFDMTVPGNACWIANGVVSHNSGAIEQDADVICFIYRDEVYNENTEEKGIAEIIIGKQRNGPIGTVRLAFLGQYTRFEDLAESYYEDYAHE
jgi:replicative DNA helicase